MHTYIHTYIHAYIHACIQVIPNVLWALAELDMQDSADVVNALCENLSQNGMTQRLTMQGLANILWALSVLGYEVRVHVHVCIIRVCVCLCVYKYV
jgi:hypothetical protein